MADPLRIHPAAALAGAMAAASRPDCSLRAGPFLAQVALRLDEATRPAIESILGGALPPTGRVASSSFGEVLGLGPDEWLVVGPDGQAGTIEAAVRPGLAAGAGAVIDLSGNRIALLLDGPAARDVLASCVALDFHPTAFRPGQCAQTLVAKAPVVIQQLDERPSYRILVRPSFTGYLVDWLVDGLKGLPPTA